VRIFNQSKDVAERIENGAYANSFANFLNVRALDGTERKQAFQLCIGIRDAPVNNYSACTCRGGWIGIQTELQGSRWKVLDIPRSWRQWPLAKCGTTLLGFESAETDSRDRAGRVFGIAAYLARRWPRSWIW
jgi:hypothetical protein